MPKHSQFPKYKKKTEVNRLIDKGVLKRKNNLEWAAPTFIIP